MVRSRQTNRRRRAGRKPCASGAARRFRLRNPRGTERYRAAHGHVAAIGLALLLWSAGVARGQDVAAAVLSPSLGRPVFVEPGRSFPIVLRRADGVLAPASVVLRAKDGRRVPLSRASSGAASSAPQPIRVTVPPETPAGTYDLLVRVGARPATVRHCVAVGRFGADLRIVHLGNMTVGDLTAPEFDAHLIDEVNLVAPDVIIATGDLLDATLSHRDGAWRRLVDFLCRFDAPVIFACGDHDDMDHYCRFVAPSPVGVVPIGPHRVIVLCDHPLAPLPRDPDQVRWVEQTLAETGFEGVTIIAAHADRPNLLRAWQQRGVLQRMISTGRIGLYLAGGNLDWDGQAFAETIRAASPMVYVRTHAASTSTRGGADGVPHYRIIDLHDGVVRFPAPAGSAFPASIPVGRLHAVFDGPADGSRPRVEFRVTNTLPVRLDELVVSACVRKTGAAPPWCAGGTLAQVVDLGTKWGCRVRLGVPDRGAAIGLIGTGPQPLVPKVAVRIETPGVLRFETRQTRDGVRYQALVSAPPTLEVRNVSRAPLVVTPRLRLDGSPIGYRPVAGAARFADAFRITLGPGESTRLQPDLSAARVRTGDCDFQVYFEGLTGVGPFCRGVRVEVMPAHQQQPHLARGR